MAATYSLSIEYVNYKSGNGEAIGKIQYIHKDNLTREDAWHFIKRVEQRAAKADGIVLSSVVVRDRPMHIVWKHAYK